MDSEEHVVINAIGGRHKVKGVLCVECNNAAGSAWDSALARDLHSLGLLIGVKRDRGGELPPLRVKNIDGEELLLHADGSMSPARVKFSETADGSGIVKIQLVARTPAEVRKVLTGVKRKYPKFDLDLAIAQAEEQQRYSESPLKFSMGFGGELSGRSLVKSVLCLAAANGVDPKTCQDARNYLLDPSGEACFGYWYERDLLLDRPNDIPLHCVAVSSVSAEGQLLGYVEFFGVRRMVVRLAKVYSGPPVHAIYCIDPRAAEQLTVQLDLGLSLHEVEAAYDYQRIPDGAIEKAFDPILRGALKRSHDLERTRAISRAIDYAFENSGVPMGELLTEEDAKRLSVLVAEQIRPYIEQVLARGRREDEP